MISDSSIVLHPGRLQSSGAWPVIAAHWCRSASFAGMARHLEALPESTAETSGVAPLDVPAVVITGGRNAGPRDPAPGLANAKRIRAEHSGQWVQFGRAGCRDRGDSRNGRVFAAALISMTGAGDAKWTCQEKKTPFLSAPIAANSTVCGFESVAKLAPLRKDVHLMLAFDCAFS